MPQARILFSTTAALAFTLGGCDTPLGTREEPPISHIETAVTGRVLNSKTHEGLENVEVRISPVGTATTGPGGIYRIGEIEALRHLQRLTISVSAPGYVPAAATIEVEAETISIPTLLLVPAPMAVSLGQDGGTIPLPGGGQIVVPPGALTGTTSISAVLAPQLAPGVQEFYPAEAALGLTLLPKGLNLAKPVQIMLPLPTSETPHSRLRARQMNAATSRWNEADSALVTENGRFAVVTTRKFEPIAISTSISITYNYDVHAATRTSTDFGTSVSGCPTEPFTMAKTTESASSGRTLSFTSSYFDEQPILDEIAEIGTTNSIAIVIVTSDDKLVTKQYQDTYTGPVTAKYHNTSTGKEITETATFVYTRYRFERSTRDCHDQGAG